MHLSKMERELCLDVTQINSFSFDVCHVLIANYPLVEIDTNTVSIIILLANPKKESVCYFLDQHFGNTAL